MQLIAVTDIFGRTRYFEELLKHISSKYSSIQVVDPYNGQEIDFKNETAAYNHFQETMGLGNYSEYLYQQLNNNEDVEQVLLGFSVGASALWVISDTLKPYKKTKAICFYSSQVRNYLHVEPKIVVDFFFSKSEPGYDVNEVVHRLSNKANVSCYKTEYSHGFMNRKSGNYNELGYRKHLEILNNT